MIKNASGQKVGVQMISATDGSAFTGSVTASVTLDAGTQATGSVGSGACTHEGNGYHTYAPSQAETNGDLVAFTFTGTGAVPQTVQIYTRAATPDVNVTQWKGSAPADLTDTDKVQVSVQHKNSALALTAQEKVDVNAEVDTGISDAALATASALATVDSNVDSILDDTGTSGVVVASMANGAITAAAIATGAIDADAIADNAIDAGAIAADAITNAKIADGAISAGKLAADTITAAKVAADVTTEIQSGLATAAALTTVDTVVDAIKAVTDNLPDSGALTSLAQASALTALETRLRGLVQHQGTIGASGNDTTHLHLDGLTQGDDELNDYLLVIFDNSASEYHARWIEDWVLSTELATVATLPFTPQDSTDTYWLLPIRQDVSGGSGLDAAGVRAAVGMASANLDTQLGTIDNNVDLILEDTGTTLQGELDGIQADTEDIQSRLPAALVSGRIDASVGAMAANTLTASALAADAVTEMQSGLATASSLSTIDGKIDTIDSNVDAILVDTAEIGVAGAGLTEAGGTGDHLTALATAANLTTVDTVVDAIKLKTDNLPSDPADQSAVEAAIDSAEAAILAAIPSASTVATAVQSSASSNPLAANVKEINDVTLTGDGSATPWGPA